ncbi:MAG: J domain-containing protein [Acidimicrobiales bacterium]
MSRAGAHADRAGAATGVVTLYDLFGVPSACTPDELRQAYRQLARQLHPDVAGLDDGGLAMAKLNEAWRILSDPDARQRYDLTLGSRSHLATPTSPQPPPRAQWSRRQAWVISIQAQMARLTRQAGRSATQTLLIRAPRADRAHYEGLVELIVASVIEDTEPRVRAARAAGAAPLDLASAASLIALRSLADRLRRESALGVNADLIMTAELIDRMWDIMAHELTSQLANGLGGNPHVAHAITHR